MLPHEHVAVHDRRREFHGADKPDRDRGLPVGGDPDPHMRLIRGEQHSSDRVARAEMHRGRARSPVPKGQCPLEDVL